MPKFHHHRSCSTRVANSHQLKQVATRLKLVLSRRQEKWKEQEWSEETQRELDEAGYVTQDDRDNECQFILSIGNSLQLSCDTYCLAYSLLDRTIGAMKIKKKLIRLLSTACLKIAIKMTEDDKRENLNRILCEASGYQYSKRDVNRMELFILEKLEWCTLDSSVCDILYCLIDILSCGRDFLSPHQRKSLATFLAAQLVDFELAKLPNLEIALGCIGTIFGSRAANRIAQIANMYGLRINNEQVLQAAIYLKPKARLLATRRYAQRYHAFCRDESESIFFDVKKLMTRGELIPVDFGSKSYAEVVRC